MTEEAAIIQSFHCKLRSAGFLLNGLPDKAETKELSQALVDSWLLKGTLSLVQWLEGRVLSSNLKQSFHDVLPELEKSFLTSEQNGNRPTVEQYLSQILPLLVRCLTMRAQFSTEPMLPENQRQLAILLDKVRKGTEP